MLHRAPVAPRIVHALGFHLEDLSDFELRLVIDFEPFTVVRRGKRAGETYTIRPVFSWKRAHKPSFIGGHGSISRTTEADKWAAAAAKQLREQWTSVFKESLPDFVAVNARIISYLPSAANIDASNLYQGPEDVLKACRKGCKPRCKIHAGVLVDDRQIGSHDGSRRRIDRKKPRVEITLTPHKDQAQ